MLFRAQNPRRVRKDDDPMTDSTINGWSSAIKNLFTMFNVVAPREYDLGVKKVKKGYAKDTVDGREKNGDGKEALPFDLMCWLSKKMMSAKLRPEGSRKNARISRTDMFCSGLHVTAMELDVSIK